MKLNLSELIRDLLKTNPFYGHLLMDFRKEIVGKDHPVKTAAVGIKNGNINLFINKDFMEILTKDMQKGILIHEIFHVAMSHLTSLRYLQEKQPVVANIAMDMAINQLIPEIRDNYIEIDKLIKEHFADKNSENKEESKRDGLVMPGKYDFEENLAAETYFELLMNDPEIKQKLQDAEKMQELMDRILDDHGEFGQGEGNETLDKAYENDIKNMLKKAYKKAGQGTGNKTIDDMIKSSLKSKIDWKALLQKFIMDNVASSKRMTNMRRNRRYGLSSPGKRYERETVLTFITDTSGSISIDEYTRAYAELSKIAAHCKEINLIYADDEVKKVEKYSSNNEFVPVGGGGTAYQPALDKARELQSNVIVYFGDMHTMDASYLKNPGIPVIWLSTDGTSPASFGKYIKIED